MSITTLSSKIVYAIHRADELGEPTIWNEQLVPAAVISPREDNRPLAGR